MQADLEADHQKLEQRHEDLEHHQANQTHGRTCDV